MNIEVPEDFVFVCGEVRWACIKAYEIFEIYSGLRIYLYPKNGNPAISLPFILSSLPRRRSVRRGQGNFDEVLREVYFRYVMR